MEGRIFEIEWGNNTFCRQARQSQNNVFLDEYDLFPLYSHNNFLAAFFCGSYEPCAQTEANDCGC